MLRGDLSTMGLADLLQWAESTRTRGILTLSRTGQETWLEVSNRCIVGASESLASPVPMDTMLNKSPTTEPIVLDSDAVAMEQLFDLFLDPDGTFEFEPGATRVNGIPIDMLIQEFVMEGMRHLDEWPRISDLYQADSMQLRLAEEGSTAGLGVVHRAILQCAAKALSLADCRLTLGLSRPGLLRRVDELRMLGRVSVEGTPPGGDLTAKLIGQATSLLREKQFEEAAHVFSALLVANPGASQVKALLKEAEREQVLALYEELPQSAVPHVHPGELDLRRLSQSDQVVLERINGRWDVAVLVLACPLREVETLKSLRKLHRLHLIEFTIEQIAAN